MPVRDTAGPFIHSIGSTLVWASSSTLYPMRYGDRNWNPTVCFSVAEYSRESDP